jgi:5-hydroxyisourate hydrolase-like protein (transthyretin family)
MALSQEASEVGWLSTYVLDSVHGTPAQDVISMFLVADNSWHQLRVCTNADGGTDQPLFGT